MRVLVTSAKSRIAYNVVRSLGSKGVDVYSADFVDRSMSFVSRYAKGHFLYPSPFRCQEAFIKSIVDAVDRLKIDVLIPVYEETFLAAKYKKLLSNHVRLVLPDYEQILIAHNKDRWAPMAKKLGIPVPVSVEIDALRNGIVKTSDLRYPVLIKPKQGGGAWGIRQLNAAEELDALLRDALYEHREWSRFFVQEKIDGDSICVAMLFNQGRLRAKVAYRQLRDFPVSGGQATFRESIRNEKTEAYLQHFLEELRWHGTCQADFIIHKKSGMPYLIDLNPRLWGSLCQAIACDVDFPYLLYKIAIDGDVKPCVEFKSGVRTRWIGGEIRAFIPLLRQSDEKLKFMTHFFLAPGRTRLFDDISLNDPLPFFVWCSDALIRTLKSSSFKPVMHDQLDGIWE